jgi:hypothetical protein
MSKEEKIEKRKKRAFLRKAKRIAKDKISISYLDMNNPHQGISWGRKRSKGKIFICEMRYGDCEERGYCNGDC